MHVFFCVVVSCSAAIRSQSHSRGAGFEPATPRQAAGRGGGASHGGMQQSGARARRGTVRMGSAYDTIPTAVDFRALSWLLFAVVFLLAVRYFSIRIFFVYCCTSLSRDCEVGLSWNWICFRGFLFVLCKIGTCWLRLLFGASGVGGAGGRAGRPSLRGLIFVSNMAQFRVTDKVRKVANSKPTVSRGLYLISIVIFALLRIAENRNRSKRNAESAL